jgi:hypothetical protein
MNHDTGEVATAEFLASVRFMTLSRRMSIEDRARQAGVEELYNIFYRSLSIGGHGHSLRKGDGDFDLAVMHMQGGRSHCRGHRPFRRSLVVHRERTDKEDLRKLLGLDSEL